MGLLEMFTRPGNSSGGDIYVSSTLFRPYPTRNLSLSLFPCRASTVAFISIYILIVPCISSSSSDWSCCTVTPSPRLSIGVQQPSSHSFSSYTLYVLLYIDVQQMRERALYLLEDESVVDRFSDMRCCAAYHHVSLSITFCKAAAHQYTRTFWFYFPFCCVRMVLCCHHQTFINTKLDIILNKCVIQ